MDVFFTKFELIIAFIEIYSPLLIIFILPFFFNADTAILAFKFTLLTN